MPGSSISTLFKDGELFISVDGITIIDRIFVDVAEGEFILAQWKLLAATLVFTDKMDGKKLCSAHRKLAVPDNPALVKQIVELEAELSALETKILGQGRNQCACLSTLRDDRRRTSNGGERMSAEFAGSVASADSPKEKFIFLLSG